MDRPFFSIILCTRNRPELIESVLISLKNQTFKNFEVILSDNSDTALKKQNVQLFNKYFFNGLKYITPKKLLSMPDHYNFALNEVSGEYIGVLTDKNLLINSALETLNTILKNNHFDIINYAHTGCHWNPNNIFKWHHLGGNKNTEPKLEVFSAKQELERRFSCSVNRSNEGKNYNFGKIFFGFYHYKLIDRVKEEYGNLFHYFSPDYNSAALALSLCKSSAYLYKPLMIAINSYMGNGASGTKIPGSTEKFIRSCYSDYENIIATLPIPNVITNHNLCAYDYEILNRLGNTKFDINYHNLAQRTFEELETFPYKNQQERLKMELNFNTFCDSKRISIKRKGVDQSINTNSSIKRKFIKFIKFILIKILKFNQYTKLENMLKS